MFGHTITRGGGWSSVPQGSIGRILEVFILPLPLSLCTPWRINSRRANREDGRVCTFVLPKRNYTFEEKILRPTRGRLSHRLSTFRNHETWTVLVLESRRPLRLGPTPPTNLAITLLPSKSKETHKALSQLPLSRTYIHVASFRRCRGSVRFASSRE